jgi:RHS repeat-associated protein
MLFKGFRSYRSPLATLLAVTYFAALCPRQARADGEVREPLAHAADERVVRDGERATGAAPTAHDAQTLAGNQRAALDLTSSGAAEPAPAPGDGDPTPGDSTPRAPGGAPIGGQTVALPSGPGTVTGLGESFSADLSTGTGTLVIPVPLLPARGGMQPSLALSYTSGGGNGLVGLGWNTGVPYIARQTERGVPKYDDRADYHAEQDHFVFNGAELVPLGAVRGGHAAAAPAEAMPPWSEGWQYFRARVEGAYYRFFLRPDYRTWRVQAGQGGGTLEFGVPLDGSLDDNAIEAATEGDPSRIYRWNVARAYDVNGAGKPTEDAQPTPANVVVFRYAHDGGITYLSDIYDTPPVGAAPRAPLASFAHHTRLAWEPRPDAISNYRRGWRVEQQLRLRRIDLTSKTYTGATAARRQVRRVHLAYDAASHYSLLTAVTLEGRCDGREDSGSVPIEGADERLPETTSCATMPPTRLSYSHVQSSSPIATVAGFEPFDGTMHEAAGSPVLPIDGSLGVMLVDVNGDGLPDVLDGDSGRNAGKHRVYFNGAGGRAGAFSAGVDAPIAAAATGGAGRIDGYDLTLKGGNVVPLDYDADGRLDLVFLQRFRAPVVFSATMQGATPTWSPGASAAASVGGPDLEITRDRSSARVVDVNGDGLVDIVVSTGTEMLTYLSLARYPGGDAAFGSAARASATQANVSSEPVHACLPASNGAVSFSDPRVQIADINADGLADIVRLKRGHVEYWPGRGDGHWGTGDVARCAAGSFASPIAMDAAPFPSVADDEVRFGDVNGDGFADVIAVLGTAVVVWLNVDGARWTAPVSIPKGPFVGTSKKTTQVADIDGSGTPDIVFGDPGRYRYVDLLGGARPWVLATVESGLGKTTTVEYTTSTAEMLRVAGTADAWKSAIPSSIPLVKRITATDNLDRIQRTRGSYTTSYDYADPFFDRRGPSFRGFRTVTTHQDATADGGGQHARSRFHVGECADEDLPGRCARREMENPRDALRGLASDVETWADGGAYLSTTHTTYRLRTLFTGLDGHEVRTVHPSASDTWGYETSPYTPGDQTVSVVAVEREPTAGRVVPESASLVVRGGGKRVHTRTEVDVDPLGHTTETRALGCVEGCAAPDEVIAHHSTYDLVPGDKSGWMYRPVEAYVTGSRTTGRRHHVTYGYDARGQLTRTSAILEGTLPLLRSHAGGAAIAPTPANASHDGTIVLTTQGYDDLGHAIDMRGAGHRCMTRSYDTAFGELPVLEVLSAGPLGADGCGSVKLVTTAIYDRAFQAAQSTIGFNGERGRVDLDSFGRPTAEYSADPDTLGAVAPLPTKTYEYIVPADGRPVVGVHTRTHRGATKTDASYGDSWDYSDALGRPLVSVVPADKANGDGGDWIVQGVVDLDARGRAVRAYAPWFWSGDPSRFPFGTRPATEHESREYDGFGRLVARRAVDGAVVERTVFHPLSSEHWDAGDLATNGKHAGTYSTSETDGHGRAIRRTERLYDGGALQVIETRMEYLPSGEIQRIARGRVGSNDAPIARWMRYDSIGRLVLNAEPDSMVGFTPDPPADVSGVRAWRYAYDDAGQLAGTSDARGCGANYVYDSAGRLLAEDRSPCLDSQPAYTAPDLATGDGTELFYRYDTVDPDVAAVTAPRAGAGSDAGAAADDDQRCPAPLSNWLGRVTSISSLGSKSLAISDGRGRPVCGAKRVVRPGVAAATLGARYAPRWYVKRFAFDGADRLVSESTGARSPGLLGSDGKSRIHASYTLRDDAAAIDGSYGTLVKSRVRNALGQPERVTFGDVAGTTTAYVYDARHRLGTVQTSRNRPVLWSGPSGLYVPNASTAEPTLQTVLEDGQFVYDEADNPIELRDLRDPAAWPVGARPVSRKIDYDDLYRATRVQYVYAAGSDGWQSPYAADLKTMAAGGTPKVQPSPHVAFDKRVVEEKFAYDWRGNVTRSDDDASGFYDRSLGAQQHGTAQAGPYQLQSASNRDRPGARTGDLAARYDEAGNLVDMVVRREGPCLPAASACWQRFAYEWSELGELSRARRWDLNATERGIWGTTGASVPPRAADAELRYAYTTGRGRVLKTAIDASGAERNDAYIYDTLELRHARFDEATGDYALGDDTETVYLGIGGKRLGRVYFAEHDVPRVQSGRQHVLLELADHLGSSSIVVDKDTSELVERTTYTAYGQTESDYRPERWDSFREAYRFTGKEDDTELGLVYIGKRYYAPALHRWTAPDPLAIHVPGAADLNVYAYVHGHVYVAVDPDGQLLWFVPILIGIAIAAAINVAQQEYKIQKAQEMGETITFDWGSLALSVGIAAVSGGAGAGAGALAGTLGASATAAGIITNATSSLTGSLLGNAAQQAARINGGGNGWNWGSFAGSGLVGLVSGGVGGGATAGLAKAGFGAASAAGFGGFAGGVVGSVGGSMVNGTSGQTSIAEHFFNGVTSGAIAFGTTAGLQKMGIIPSDPKVKDPAATTNNNEESQPTPAPPEETNPIDTERQKLLGLLHKRELGLDTGKGQQGKWNPNEAETGSALEQQLGRPLERSASGDVDWVDKGGTKYDSCSPPADGNYKMDAYMKSLVKHGYKADADPKLKIVIDPRGFGPQPDGPKAQPSPLPAPVQKYLDDLSPQQRGQFEILKF